ACGRGRNGDSAKADYAGKVDAALKDFRKKANMPGFRPGQVPMSLLKKRFGKEVLAEEVNKLLGEKLYGYIRENNINILGEPLPNEERQQNIDFDTMEEFEFVFDIALAPEFKVELTADDTLDYYTINVDEDMLDKQVKMYTQRAGNYEKVEAYEEKDMVKGLLAELDENGNTKEGGIQVEHAVMLPDYMKNDEEKQKFAGCKVNDVLVINPYKAYEGHDVELSSLLKIKKEEAAEMKSDFSYQIEEITRFKEAELNQDLFDQVLGKDVVTSEADFRAKIKELLENQFVADSNYKLMQDVRKYLVEKVGELEYPEALLKRVMKLNNRDKDDKFIEENYPKSIEELTWHLIKEQLVKTYGIKVEQADVLETAKNVTKIQFAQYGMMNVPEDMLNNYAQEMLKKKEQVDGLVSRCIEDKLGVAISQVVTLNKKSVSLDEFNKMFA
ncbi:trigger factor, partial [Bacteroides acidifaciens]|uniref:trigger factor n=1 Tax=Bacteroides acidifaciens TaxID=85831 RepID=UPI00258A0277